tara:strand:- start:967 stop:1182 length:216 start_codon:yes stop_codon:yes gene_type:complete
MHRFVKERIKQIVDSYPIGKEFSINRVHGDMYKAYGPAYLPSRAAVLVALEENARVLVKTVNNRTVFSITN